METNYDLVIIGAGAGGTAVARRIAPTGKKILILERGTWLPREVDNWNATQVAVKGKYENAQDWLDKDNNKFHSNAHYNVGGNSKFWGAAMFRFREKDFQEFQHPDGISPEWPLKYDVFKPYYAQAEKLYDCHGARGEDHTAPPMDEDYPFPAIAHEPRFQELHDDLLEMGLHPFHLPTGIRLDEDKKFLSECVRCNTCDGFPCLIGAKADAEWNGARPALEYPNVTLLTDAKVLRLLSSPSGREVSGVETEVKSEDGSVQTIVFKGDIVVVACGAINSAALLLRSANDQHPTGFANSSDQVGRNYMYHLLGAMIAISERPNPIVFEKTFGLNDFYWGDDWSDEKYPFPLGNVQSTGQILPEMVEAMFGQTVDGKSFQEMSEYATDWWFMTEDVPDPNNRITWEQGTIKITYKENNRVSYDRLRKIWCGILDKVEEKHGYGPNKFLDFKVPINGVAHQCGSLRFGTDPKTSVLNLDCQTHDVDNLYVTDSSFYVSSAALNPTNMLLANALRVADRLIERMK